MLYGEKTTVESKNVTVYERAHRVELSNVLGKVPQIVYVTSYVERDNDTGVETQKEAKRYLTETYEPGKTFTVYDAAGAPVGDVTHDQLLGMVYSLFFAVAAEADS